MIDDELLEHLKHMLDVDSVVIVTAKKKPEGGHKIDGGSGVHEAHVKPIIRVLCTIAADLVVTKASISNEVHEVVEEERHL